MSDRYGTGSLRAWLLGARRPGACLHAAARVGEPPELQFRGQGFGIGIGMGLSSEPEAGSAIRHGLGGVR
jgi:hypothetical protein